MTERIMVIGRGVLADTVHGLLAARTGIELTYAAQTPTTISKDIDFGIVLDDGWHPSLHLQAEDAFQSSGVPMLRGFVAFGNGFIGPLVRPGKAGCLYCADTRLVMADANRNQVWQLRLDFSRADASSKDAWASRSGFCHLANLLVQETVLSMRDIESSRLIHHTICVNLNTLNITRHFVLPNASCPRCASIPTDTAESAIISLEPSPKLNGNSYRVHSLEGLEETLAHDYLDATSGLLNAKVQDLVTPFAAVSVNLPLMMGDEGTSGRGHSYKECEPVAILEALERFCGLEPRGKQSVMFDSYANLKDHALHPAKVGLHDTEQYQKPGFPFRPFDENAAMEWVWGYSLTDERPILVPKRLAYYSLPCQDGFVYETSNGCALGSTYAEAVFHGILEVVERDAFLITWYARLPLPAIDLTVTKDRELQWMMDRVRYVAGYNLHFYNATMDNGIPTVFVIAKNTRAHGLNLMCSAGAHLDAMRAIKGAIQETAGMLLRFDAKLEAEREIYMELLRDGNRVKQMEEHSMLYGLPEAEERLAFLLNGTRPVQTFEEAFTWDSNHVDLRDDLREMLTIFKRLQMDVIVVDQTSPELARNGLRCVKVMIPGMLPMTFGQQLRRVEHLDRVLTVPATLGYAHQPLTLADLNPHPHPFP